ncbi:MAG: Gfo/Idh/MocA family oxidoreductase [Campylobacterota bacterium]|nr:Gfo/Idh/MocA family oxidoreductase [Campylobacterota bacterium]
MNFLVIGLGSMGKRRVRNLQALNQTNISGFDISQKRCDESKDKYGIDTYLDFEEALREVNPDVFIISTPPNLHMQYAYIAYEQNIHCFIEASVVDSQKILELSKKIKDKDLIIVPSCTMTYYFAQQKLKELIDKKIIGKPLNFNYQSGQYLPDWHPWEDINDFYVSSPDTGGAREIVPFELTWLNMLFKHPKPLACVKRKLTDMNAPIDDIYHCILEYPDGLIGNLTVEVVSRPKAVREFRVIGTTGEIAYSADTNELKYINTSMKDWEYISFDAGTIEKEYINPEEPYINEIQDFLNAIVQKDITLFPNSLENDYKVLNNLYDLEQLTGDTDELSR